MGNRPMPGIMTVVNMIARKCHCGRKQISAGHKHWPYRMGVCDTCAKIRCDIDPMACKPVWEFQRIWGPEGRLSINTGNNKRKKVA